MDRAKQIFWRAAVLFFTLLIFVQIGGRIVNTRIEYDEGYALQVSENFHNSLAYKSYQTYFDAFVTTGPTVLIPAALFISRTFPLLPRIVPFLYAALFICLCWIYIFTTRRQKLIFLIILNFTPLFFFFSSHVFGELPAFTFLLLSYILLTKKARVTSGICIALAVLTKSAYIIGAIPLFISIATNETQIKKAGVHLVRIFMGSLGVYIIWKGYQLATYRMDIPLFLSIESYTLEADKILSNPAYQLLVGRLRMIQTVFHIPWIIFVLITVYIATSIIVTNRKQSVVTMLSVFFLLFSLQFFIFGATEWYRHFFPAVISLAIIVPSYLDPILSRRTILICAAIIALAGLAGFNAITSHPDPTFRIEQNLYFDNEGVLPVLRIDPVLTAQFAAAAFIRDHIPGSEHISGVGWWNAPEISYLTGRRIERYPYRTENAYLITDMYGTTFAPVVTNLVRLHPHIQTLFSQNDYVIYKKL